MKAFAVGGIVVVVLILIFIASKVLGNGETESRQEKTTTSPIEDDLSSIKERIKDVEKYRMRERYEAPGNPGITIAGTFLECVIDIAVALLRQSNIKKAALTLTDNENNGKVIAQMMRQITDEVVKVCEGTNFLACQKCEDVKVDEKNSERKCKIAEESSMDVHNDDCDKYVIHSKNIEDAVQALLKKKVITNALSDDAINAIVDIAAYNAEKAGRKVTDEEKSKAFEQIQAGWSSTRGKILK